MTTAYINNMLVFYSTPIVVGWGHQQRIVKPTKCDDADADWQCGFAWINHRIISEHLPSSLKQAKILKQDIDEFKNQGVRSSKRRNLVSTVKKKGFNYPKANHPFGS